MYLLRNANSMYMTLLGAGGQFVMTTVFGIYATFLLLRTGECAHVSVSGT